MIRPRVADLNAGEWSEHSRFKGILMKGLLTSADNPLASVNVVRVPLGGVIDRHRHLAQVETVYIVAGECCLTLENEALPMAAGEIVAIPMGIEHTLRNDGPTPVELLTIFTPPLT